MHLRYLVVPVLLALPAAAQMPGMEMPPQSATPQPIEMKPAQTLIDSILQHTSSGTSAEPPSVPMSMVMTKRDGWQLMLHGNAFVADTQQHASSERGSDKLFSVNWIMPMAQRKVGPGQLTLRTMLSLEPATITGRAYPEVFQQGETRYGQPIVDGQHPHDFVMELAALYDVPLAKRTLLSLYLAPVGDPAIGPTAYPHRQSASEDSIAALGHHQEDSTHIAFNVMTLGLTQGPVRVEVSGFHGAEPTEARWHFQPSPNGSAPDSYSGRITYVPSKNWAAQYSIAHIISPEAINPNDNQRRQTLSVMYNRPVGAHHDTTSMPGMDMGTPANGNWSNTFLWGQTHSLSDNSTENSYLLESLLQFGTRNYVWTRVESADRTTELYGQPRISAAGFQESPLGHVQAYTLGYDRDFKLGNHLLAAPGAQFTLYHAPDALATIYGRDPFAAQAFVRFRLH